ncbi:MAG: GNAT family N-acetyltransferase [Armatimonadota bacterium]|nr:GNAT family N-acetyltransferase [Armatimonadota bacterium]
MQYRPFNPQHDREAAHRIWREVGWLKRGEEAAMDRFLEGNRALVAELNGQAECLVLTMPGTIRYLQEDLPLTVVTGVTTSRVARKQGLAGRLTARAVAAAAAEGALVAALGMFEQGYYDRLGFGSGGYEHWLHFDPAHVRVPVRARVPQRLTADDWQAAHAARLARWRGHGGCNLTPPQMTRRDMEVEDAFGLGYADGPNGEWTHYFWCSAHRPEWGPYHVHFMVYRTRDEFLELMALLAGLGDQVRLIELREPAGVQLQDFLVKPFRHRAITERSRFENTMHASAYWQMRICNLPGCLARTSLPGPEVRFNLRLTDPIASLLPDGPWQGVGGDYVVCAGSRSWAQPGADAELPTLQASVGAFTRLWLGVRPATGLAVTDDLTGPPELLAALDHAFRLPDPHPDWDF